MLRKILIGCGIVLAVVVVILGLFMFRLMWMARSIEGKIEKMEVVNLSRVADGVYAGAFGDFVNQVKLKVAVKGHRITKITMVDQRCGAGYEALETIPRIIKAQSPKVDVITGASSSSRCIMLAVNGALKKAVK